MLNSIDALVTYHGTAGVEFAAMGGPVLVPDRGKYDRCGFAFVAKSRGDYLDRLSTNWWGNAPSGQRNALIYAGMFFAAPDWQGKLLNRDEFLQDELYEDIIALFHRPELSREVAEIRDWWETGERHYHTFRMMRADGFQLTNVKP